VLSLTFGFSPASAQSGTDQPQVDKSLQPAGSKAELYCAGFIEYAHSQSKFEIVGGYNEQEQRVYAEGDYVFINAGAQQNLRVGQELTVVRPRGQFKSELSKKKGWLGTYVQEVGRLRVTEVKDRVSVAQIIASCDTILLGDLLKFVTPRAEPPKRLEVKIDRFSNPNGKPTGRIVLARDYREMLSTGDIVYIDLGTQDGLNSGDFLTVYRPAGYGNISRFRDEEVTLAASGGFESFRYKGGKFSNKAQRVKRANETGVYGPTVTTPDVKRRRPPVPRKVVGELVVLSVQERTATARITRVAQEVHTGDYVEIQ
jgi:hypothetical protein